MGVQSKLRALACAAAVALAAAAPAAAAPTAWAGHLFFSEGPRTERGIVQSVSPRFVVLRALDGTAISVPLDARTRIFLNDRPAALGAVRPGFVAVATFEQKGPARELRAYDAGGGGQPVEVRGTVQSVTAGAVVLRDRGGALIAVPLDSATRIVVNGRAASLADVRPGQNAVAVGEAGGPARELRVEGAPPPPVQVSGVVQSVSEGALVLRGRDGALLAVPLDPATRIVVNGRSASPADIRPGMNAVAFVEAGGSAREVRVENPRPVQINGVVESVLPDAIVIRDRGGAVVAVPFDSSTRVLLNGRPAAPADARPGFGVVAVRVGEAPALELRFTRRR